MRSEPPHLRRHRCCAPEAVAFLFRRGAVRTADRVLGTLLVSIVGFLALGQPAAFPPQDEATDPATAAGPGAPAGRAPSRVKYAKSGLTSDRIAAYARGVQILFEQEKPYRDCLLNLPALSRHCRCPCPRPMMRCRTSATP